MNFNICSNLRFISAFSKPTDGQVIPEKAPCLGCEVEIDENSEDLKSPLSVSITKYNSMSDSTHLFALHTVGSATRQVVGLGVREGGISGDKNTFPPACLPCRWSQVSGSR